MDNEIIDISEFRVRVPADLFPYRGSHVLELRRVKDLPWIKRRWFEIQAASASPVAGKVASGERIFCGEFTQRNRFNIPGPFYGAETDTCATGPHEAPNNVLLDASGQEFVWCQPRNIHELRQIIGAAITDPFQGYGADGNDHWTLGLIREWWEQRTFRLAEQEALRTHNGSLEAWLRYTSEEACEYLRRYAFFVEERKFPSARDFLHTI